jgi:hypothetical protein
MKEEPKDLHGVQFNLNVNSKDAGIVREALEKAGLIGLSDTFELKRELAIMKEVVSCEGSNICEKADNCLEIWRKGNYYDWVEIQKPKYKMKHKVLHATNA